VKVTDAAGNPVAEAAVTFAIVSGGGSITGGNQTTNISGIATIGSWTPGSVGANTLSASAIGLTGSPITFVATGTAGAASKLALTTVASATAQNRVPFATQPVVQIQDANGNAVRQSATVVTVALTTGGATLGGTTTATTSINGAAAFSNLSISGAVGGHTLTFSAPGLTSATASVTTLPGAASTLSVVGGNNQSAIPGTPLPVSPSVKTADADGNAVPGLEVIFAVVSGGGSATGLTQTTNLSGVATVGSWTIGGATGTNTMTAASTGLSGSPVTFTATASALSLASVTPALLTPGLSATITGQGFSTIANQNAVTIDGVAATVTAASATQLSITVPTALPCTEIHSGMIKVSVGGANASITKPLQVAKHGHWRSANR
jgi:adhesin/invasin